MVKAIIVLVLGIVLLGGAGFGGWTLYQKYMVPHEGEEPKKPEPPPPPPPTAYIRMAPIAVPVIGPKRVEQFVSVVVTVEVVADKLPMMQARQPMLVDGFLTALYGALDDKSVMTGNLVNLAAVKEKLMEVATRVGGPGVVQNVLIQVVTQRGL